jgi:hypothetical protein
MDKNQTYFALIEASQQPGCPVCRLVSESVEKYLSNLLYENVNDVILRRDLRLSLGFCNLHARVIAESGVGSALGISIIYQDVLSNLLRSLPDIENTNEQDHFVCRLFKRIPRSVLEIASRVRKTIRPIGDCPACIQQGRSTEVFVSVLVDSLLDERLAKNLSLSDGLCLPHLDLAIREVKDERTLLKLIALTREKYSHLNQELSEIIRKSDYRFQDEGFGGEGNAWRRVLAMVSGGDRLGDIRDGKGADSPDTHIG